MYGRYVASEKDVFALMMTGEKNRAVSSTNMNAHSSRSHSVLILTLTQKLRDGSSRQSKLNFADLAGSEKVKKTAGACPIIIKV